MTLDDNKAVVRRFYEEVHGGNIDVLDKAVASSVSLQGWTADSQVVMEEMKQGLVAQRIPFPGWKITVN